MIWQRRHLHAAIRSAPCQNDIARRYEIGIRRRCGDHQAPREIVDVTDAEVQHVGRFVFVNRLIRDGRDRRGIVDWIYGDHERLCRHGSVSIADTQRNRRTP